MTGTDLEVIRTWLTLSWNDANKYEGIIKFYARPVNQLLRCYEIGAVVPKTKERIFYSKHGSLPPWNFTNILCDLSLTCDGLYKEETLRGFFVENIDFGIRTTVRIWWAGNCETPVQDTAHQAQSLFDLQADIRKQLKRKRDGLRFSETMVGIQSEEESHVTWRKSERQELCTHWLRMPVRRKGRGHRILTVLLQCRRQVGRIWNRYVCLSTLYTVGSTNRLFTVAATSLQDAAISRIPNNFSGSETRITR